MLEDYDGAPASYDVLETAVFVGKNGCPSGYGAAPAPPICKTWPARTLAAGQPGSEMDALAERRQRALAMAEPVVPRAKIDEVLAATAVFAESLCPDTRRQLAALEKLAPAQLAGQTVPVDVAAVLGLVHAHGEIVDLLRAEIARLNSELQASKQASFPL